MFRPAAAIVVAVGLVIPAALVTAATAAASCATDHPAPSPYAFLGTVIDTKKEGRIATVITDASHRVTVMGADARWFARSFSSVDRRYVVGARYEFHPTNASNPYRDNACRATRKLAGPQLQPLKPRKGFLADWLPVDEQAGPIGYAAFFLPVLAGTLVLLAVVTRVRRNLVRRKGRRSS